MRSDQRGTDWLSVQGNTQRDRTHFCDGSRITKVARTSKGRERSQADRGRTGDDGDWWATVARTAGHTAQRRNSDGSCGTVSDVQDETIFVVAIHRDSEQRPRARVRVSRASAGAGRADELNLVGEDEILESLIALVRSH